MALDAAPHEKEGPRSKVVGVLNAKLKAQEMTDAEKFNEIRSVIASRIRETIGYLHHLLRREQDVTLSNLAHLLTVPSDDPDFRLLVSEAAAGHGSALELAQLIEEGFSAAGRNVRPRINAMEKEERTKAISTLIRYVQHLLSLAENGERVRTILGNVTGPYDSQRTFERAWFVSNDPDVIELFLRIEEALKKLGVDIHAEFPALREMFEAYSKKLSSMENGSDA